MTNKSGSEIKEKLIKRDGLRCSITGQKVKSPDELIITHIFPLSAGGTDDITNMHLVTPSAHAFFDADSSRANGLAKELIRRQQDLALQEKENFEREHKYRSQIEIQKQELEKTTEQLRRQYKIRENELERELAEQKESMRLHQESLLAKERKVLEEVEKTRSELDLKENLLKEKLEELDREKERYREEHRVNLQARSNAYVNDAIAALDHSAKTYHSKGKWWSYIGTIALACGVITGILFGIEGLTPLENDKEITWPLMSFLAFKGMIVIGLFIALSKYCYTYSQSFIHEAIKNSERKHAINFGKFYLETYGADAQWSQVKEAFEHWNINSTSAFSGGDPDKFDPKIFDKALEIAEAAKKFTKEKT